MFTNTTRKLPRNLGTTVMLGLGLAMLLTAAPTAKAQNTLPFSTKHLSEYLLIGMGSKNQVDNAIDADNVELGSHKAPAPIYSSFANNSAFGPALLGNVPNIPLSALPVSAGINHSGNIAVTHPQGRYTFQNAGIYANVGVQSAGSISKANDGLSHAFYYNTSFTDDPNNPNDGAGGFPNTLNSTWMTNPGVNNNTSATGTKVDVGSVPAQYRAAAGNGLTGGVDFSNLLSEINTASAAIKSMAPGHVDGQGSPIHFASINLSSKYTDGYIDKSMHPSDKGFATAGPITASASSNSDKGTFHVALNNIGLTVIDFTVGKGKDINLNNYNFVIDGEHDSFAIFRIPEGSNFIINNGNVLTGISGIGKQNVLFYINNGTNSNDTHFNFNNAVLNGIAFWDLSMGGGDINLQNVQGCAQFIGDKIDLSNVRLILCESSIDTTTIPEPASMALLGLAAIALLGRRR